MRRHVPYKSRKSCGDEWLGEVPEHWKVKRLKYVASGNDDVLEDSTSPAWDLLYVDIGNVDSVAGIIAKEEMVFENAPSRARRLVADGDTIVSTVRTYLKAIAGIHQPEPNLVVSTGFAVIRPRAVQPNFLAFFLRSHYFIESIVSRSSGVSYPVTNLSDVLETLVTLPPASEQQAIAEFLDRETGRLSRLVAKKRRLIERLNEKRAALISRTTTGGLPPTAVRAAGFSKPQAFKTYGLDWLVDIPEHWELLPVRRRAKRIQTGGTPPTAEERYYEDGTVPWYGPGSFDDQIALTQPVKFLNALAVAEGAARMFAAGATMVVTVGATLGKVSSLTEPGSCNQQITVIEFDPARVHPRFATYQIKRLEPTLRAIAPCSTLAILDQEEVADLVLGFPPMSEQATIAAYLDAETAKLDALVAKVEEAVERLLEYRTALITAAVTGKIDLRTDSHG